MRSRTIRAASIAGLLLSVAVLRAQDAQIIGETSDSSGGMVPGVTIGAINIERGTRRSTTSNAEGHYAIPLLYPGPYQITLTRPGFRPISRSGIVLEAGQLVRLDFSMEVGAMSERVDVTERQPLLDNASSSVARLVESKLVESMPLADRRAMNILRLIGPAVVVNIARDSAFSLAGGRTGSSMFLLDGGTNQNVRLGVASADIDPPVESIREVKVISNNYSAEYGASAAGIVSAQIKSGLNELHGSLFEYLRNDRLDAADFFAPIAGAEKVKAPLRFNIFGGSAGGPIRRRRTFFFVCVEGSRRTDGLPQTFTVPTVLQRAGDFSGTLDSRGTLVPIYDPSSTQMINGNFVRAVFPGNRIPGSRIDPVALGVLPFYPLPNRAPDNLSGASNFRANAAQISPRESVIAKLDDHTRTSDWFSLGFIYTLDDDSMRSVLPNPAAEPVSANRRRVHYWNGQWSHVSGSVVNQVRFVLDDREFRRIPAGAGGAWPDKLGLAGVSDLAFPQFSAAGFITLGAPGDRVQSPIRQYQISNSTSWVRGRHDFKFGEETRRSSNNEVNRLTASGVFNFAPTATAQPRVANTGNGFASLLTGFPTTFSMSQTPALDRSSWYLAAFAQDDWAVSHNLTLNLGIRWETDVPFSDAHQRISGFDPAAINPDSGTPGVVRFAGSGGGPPLPFAPDWNNFAPRVGFALRPFGSTRFVIRGGYGIAYSYPGLGTPTRASVGFASSTVLQTPDGGITAPFFLRAGVSAAGSGQRSTSAVDFFETNRRTGYSQQFNFSVQRQLAGQVLLEAAYIGQVSRKLPNANLSMNQIPPERLGAGATQADRPFPQFSDVLIDAPTLGVSSYNAASLRVEKRSSRGLSLLASYTWSKLLSNVIDTSVGDNASSYSNAYNRSVDRGSSGNDIRHRVAGGLVYELPVGPGRRLLSTGAAGRVLGGWSLGSLANVQSGAPFTVVTQVDSTFSFAAGPLRADVLRNPNLKAGDRSLTRWFDTDALRQPAPYQFGNQGVNILRAAGKIKLDLSLLRDFPLWETWKLQVRGEFLNSLNHPNFGLPGRTLGAADFGTITTADPARQVQLGLRVTF